MRLSQKHGLNPSCTICFWCGESKEVVLFGSHYKRGQEAPREVLMDYDPCADCKELMAQGVAMVEVTKTPNIKDQFQIAEGAYPTGRWVVVKSEFVQKVVNPPELAAQIIEKGKCWIEPETWNALGFPNEDQEEKEAA